MMSLRVTEGEKKAIRAQARARGFSSHGAYIRWLFQQDANRIAQEKR